MFANVTMSEQDHFLATLFVTEATPTFMGREALDLLASATLTGPGRTYRLDADTSAISNLVWAMDQCVELIELDCSKVASSCCDAFDHDFNTRLEAATRRLESELEGFESIVDHDGGEDRDDRDMVDCGPEYPRNDAGEWVGRM